MQPVCKAGGNVPLLLFMLLLTWMRPLSASSSPSGLRATRAREVLPDRIAGVVVAVLLSSVLFGFLHTEQGVIGVVITTLDAIFWSTPVTADRTQRFWPTGSTTPLNGGVLHRWTVLRPLGTSDQVGRRDQGVGDDIRQAVANGHRSRWLPVGGSSPDQAGQTYGSTPAERRLSLLGDDIVPGTRMVTNHAITIDAPPTASGHGLCRWDGIAPAGTPLAGSTSCSSAQLAERQPDHSRATAHRARGFHPRRCSGNQVD